MNSLDNILEYKGYTASLHYAHEDKCFFGKVEYIDGLITFEAQNANELQSNFEDCINDYIQMCKDENIEPQKTFNGNLALRLGRELHKTTSIYAKTLHTSLNQFCIDAIEDKITGLEKRYAY